MKRTAGPGDEAEEELAYLRRFAASAIPVIEAVAARKNDVDDVVTPYSDYVGTNVCVFCDAEAWRYGGLVYHEKGCPVRVARAILLRRERRKREASE